MAAHHISLAKASFGVSLLRPDVTKINRDDLPNFHRAFDAALVQCSRHNIQVRELSRIMKHSGVGLTEQILDLQKVAL